MVAPTRETVAYEGSSPDGSAPERVRVALVAGSGGAPPDDFHDLLRRRLIALGTFFGAVLCFLLLLDIASGPDPDVPYRATYRELLVGNVRWCSLVAVNLATAWVLWRRPPHTLFGLRVAEAVIVGPVVGLFLIFGVSDVPYEPLVRAASAPAEVRQAFVGRYANAGGLLWFLAITAYGTIVPNTLRRAALVTSLIAVSPLALFFVYANWVRPLDPAMIGEVLVGIGIGNLIAVVLVLFSTSRIEFLRRQAGEARKLGQYVLKEQLGSGGMGEVYRAEHVLLRRPCALKLIRPERTGDPAALRRFEREVQATAALTHPNTVQVFDYGHTPDGTFYYVMEYLPGLTLEELVRRHGPVPPGRVVHFLRQICAALAEAHARGLTHRDVKPGNVMVCERGGVYDVVKVLDFGLVRVPKEDADDATLTREGTVAGTPAYLSPEQAGGQDGVDPRSDLYSVGALAYFLLTGKPPFADRPAVRMIAAHLYEPAAPPPGVPADLVAVVLRCLEKAPADRWPDAASLDAALAATAVPLWQASDAKAWWESVGLTPCP